jgi:hypothetical protein
MACLPWKDAVPGMMPAQPTNRIGENSMKAQHNGADTVWSVGFLGGGS